MDRALNSAFSSGLVTGAYTTGANATGTTATGLAASTTYYFRTRATNASGDSTNSNTASAMTQSGGGGGSPTTHEAESLTETHSTGDAVATITPAGVSGSAVRLTGNAIGDWIQFTANVATAGSTNVKVQFHRNAYRAISKLLVDGTQLGSPYDAHNATADVVEIDYGNVSLSAGNHAFRFEVTGRNAASSATDYQIAVDYIKLTPQSTNTAPTISNVTDQTINVNGNTGALAFTVGDTETAAGSLTVSGTSSNTTLVPNANIVFGGSGANRTVTVTPAAGQTGSATITVTVSDGSLTAQDTFVVTVNPTVSVSATDANASEAGLDPGTFTFTRVGTTTAALTVNFSVSGAATSGTDYTSIGTSVAFAAGSATATKTVTPIQDTAVEGTETVIVTLASGTGYSVGSPNSATVNLADNDVPPPVVYDANSLTISASSGDSTSAPSDAGASGGVFFVYLSNAASGDYVSFTVNAPVTATYAVSVRYHKNAFRGIVQLNIDGNAQGSATDCYVPTANKGFVNVPLGNVSLTAGNHTFQFQVNGHNASSSDFQIGLDTITLTP